MKPKFVLAALLLPAALAAHAGDHGPQWGYEGAHGPAKWGELAPDFAECKLGREQSPIDIRGAKRGKLPALDFAYAGGSAEVVNNGHTIQVDLNDGGTLTLDGVPYKLVQFHFHAPSEEKIKGKAYPMVAHLVHRNADGGLAVVAVMFKQGKANAALKPVFGGMPGAAGEKKPLAGGFDAGQLLPQSRGYYRFMGSLTTPPCSEGVRWQVLKQPVEVSKAQIDAFRKLYRHNARPVQSLNGRKIEES
jgi:carbonic anhydrase